VGVGSKGPTFFERLISVKSAWRKKIEKKICIFMDSQLIFFIYPYKVILT
jgi:hypothetical protein